MLQTVLLLEIVLGVVKKMVSDIYFCQMLYCGKPCGCVTGFLLLIKRVLCLALRNQSLTFL